MARPDLTYRAARRRDAKEMAKTQGVKLRQIWPQFYYDERQSRLLRRTAQAALRKKSNAQP